MRRRLILLAAALCPALALAHATFDTQLAELKEKLVVQPANPALYFRLAELYCEHEEPANALAALEQVKTLGPDDLPVDYLGGMCLLLAERPAEAIVALDRFVKAHPDNAPARLQRARVQAALGDIPKCLDEYRAALRLSPRPEPDLVQETADALAKYGRIDEAVQVLDAALTTLGPVPSLTLRAIDLETATGRFDAALTRVDVLQKLAPRPEPWMAKRARLLSQAGKPAEARAAWQALLGHIAGLPNLERGSTAMSRLAEEAQAALVTDAPSTKFAIKPGSVHEEELQRANEQLAAAPADGQLWYRRSQLLVLDGEWEQALRDAAQADRLAPGKFATEFVRGQALALSGRVAEGKAVLDRFLETHPDHAPALAARARLSLRLSDPESAARDFRAAIGASAKPDASLVQEVVDFFSARNDREAASAILVPAIAALGEPPALVTRALDLELAAGHFDAALEYAGILQAQAPRPEAGMARRAQILAEAGRAAEARAAWQALEARIASLPNLERGSPAITRLAAQARQALSPSFSSVVQKSSPSQ